MKRILTYIIAFCCWITVEAQQQNMYSQYMYNGFLINPAMAGVEGFTSFNVSGREQWAGLKDPPSLYSFSGQARLLNKKSVWLGRKRVGRNAQEKVKDPSFRPPPTGRLGIGGSVINDQNGLIDRTGIQLAYAYHIPLGGPQLSFGISASFNQLRLDQAKVITDVDEPLLNKDDFRIFFPEANIGAYFYHSNFYIGAAANNLIQSALKFGQYSYDNYLLYRHYYAMTGYTFYAGDLAIEPSVLSKLTQNLGFQNDFSLKFIYNYDYWAGFSVRDNGYVIAFIGLSYQNFRMGYAVDFSTNALRNYSYGSHEIILSFDIGRKIPSRSKKSNAPKPGAF